ncbi:MAG: hypothetical protein B6245_06805 [Desulfobacteraceae bacterium 4572_88]|nr:MAG: hypothetical protein B6245_06805 [Desulfobacteraceae bacterium 4572_88]
MLIVIYFLLIDGHKLITFIMNISPLPPEQDEKLIENSHRQWSDRDIRDTYPSSCNLDYSRILASFFLTANERERTRIIMR